MTLQDRGSDILKRLKPAETLYKQKYESQTQTSLSSLDSDKSEGIEVTPGQYGSKFISSKLVGYFYILYPILEGHNLSCSGRPFYFYARILQMEKWFVSSMLKSSEWLVGLCFCPCDHSAYQKHTLRIIWSDLDLELCYLCLLSELKHLFFLLVYSKSGMGKYGNNIICIVCFIPSRMVFSVRPNLSHKYYHYCCINLYNLQT